MISYLIILALPFLFLADYLAIIFWLMRSADKPQRNLRFSKRTLLIAMTVAAIHVGMFTAFLSVRTAP